MVHLLSLSLTIALKWCIKLVQLVVNMYADISCMMQVIVRNVPPDPDESVSELVEHFFLVNHPEHYLNHQVKIFP